jgi:hypothetical protein
MADGFSQQRPGFNHRTVLVGFLADKVTMGQRFYGYFGFPCQFSSQECSSLSSVIRDWYNWPTCGPCSRNSVSPDPRNKLSQLSSYPFEKQTVAHLVKKCLDFTEPVRSLPCSQKSSTGTYLEADEWLQVLPSFMFFFSWQIHPP